MTREEALNRDKYIVNFIDSRTKAFSEKSLINHINKIYDDFKNRTCENCIHVTPSGNGCCFDKSFGCNKWEPICK